ncbi:hypothetical protein NDN08_001457 [Rhodosorus marinus]|uniref:2-methoxy-6-polyprenyl-1,4-benzoquinol methylase, mitochondrial n=1 Tax=Rhodosorus marinus TaxID=101924 RepID=A0AAV8USC4_9RHOD|nr:hypothetical protein NDN08_001457 [Rhodosorus marinus]
MTLSLLTNSRRGVSLFQSASRSLSRTVQKNQPDRDPTGNGGIGGSMVNEAEHSQTNGRRTEQVETTHFGFQDIPVNEKSDRVRGVFANVAENYDLMNDLMSGGMHRRWKASFVKSLGATPDMKIIDVAGGTGDISFRILDDIKQIGALESPIKVLDPSVPMLEVGRRRASELNYAGQVEFEIDDAEELSTVADDSVDAYLISFGMRNVTNPAKALQQALRVLRRGGRFMMLEFAKVDNPIGEQLYDAYSVNLIPSMGEAVTGDRASYTYLVESIRRFPGQEEFGAMMEEAGFRSVQKENLSFGVVCQYSGFKL